MVIVTDADAEEPGRHDGSDEMLLPVSPALAVDDDDGKSPERETTVLLRHLLDSVLYRRSNVSGVSRQEDRIRQSKGWWGSGGWGG